MRFSFILLFLGFGIVCCGGSPEEPKILDEPTDFVCRICHDPEDLDVDSDRVADEGRCKGSGVSRNFNKPCVVDGETYVEHILTYDDCRREIICPDQDYEVLGGASGTGEWDYECHFCDADVSEIDGAHDGGVESARCDDSGILPDSGKECAGGGRATVVAFSGCVREPSCVKATN